MQSKLLALAAFTLAGTAFAQCGLNQLTTPPSFVSNNGGAVGGMVFFSLTVTAANGISICGVDVNTSVANGSGIGCSVYLHNSITDWNNLTGALNTPGDWNTVACLSGTSMGLNTSSPLGVLNSTGTIDLAPGQHLMAIGNGTFNHRYTNGTGLNQNISDANLTFDGGLGANVVNSATFFNPRIFNGTFDYNVAGAPITTSPGGVNCAASSCVTVGTGCGAAADSAHIFEQFSAANPFDFNGFLFDSWTAFGGGNSVTTGSGANPPIIPPVSPDLALGDDQNTPLIPLGFNLAAFGLPCVDSISIASNGYIWLGELGPADFSETAAEFHSQGARLAVLWDDLQPMAGGGAGTIHVDTPFANTVVVTWLGVNYFGGGPAITMQCLITPGQILFSYDTSSVFNDSGIAGFANGFAQPVTAAVDLNGAPVGPIPSGGVGDLTLACVSAPQIGGALTVELSNAPNGGVAAVGGIIGATGPGVALPAPPWSAGCTDYIGNPIAIFALVPNTNPCGAYPFVCAVPNDVSFIGLPIAAQGWAFNPGTGSLSASNAVDSLTGNF